MKHLIALSTALLLASLAQAQDPSSPKTRAEVIAELQRARESGELAAMHAEIGVNGYLGTRPATYPLAVAAAPRKPTDKVQAAHEGLAALQSGK
jgi:hypothetical protein